MKIEKLRLLINTLLDLVETSNEVDEEEDDLFDFIPDNVTVLQLFSCESVDAIGWWQQDGMFCIATGSTISKAHQQLSDEAQQALDTLFEAEEYVPFHYNPSYVLTTVNIVCSSSTVAKEIITGIRDTPLKWTPLK